MNILLFRPKPHRETIGLHSFMICEPLELEYLASSLEQDGHHVTIVDMILETRGPGYFVRKYMPDIVGFTAYIIHVDIVKQYARQVKQISPAIVTIAGGVHAEVVPGDFIEDSIDFIVHVNGIKTFKEIISSLHLGIKTIKKEVPGVWDGPGKPYVMDTSFSYPHPDREKTRKYRDRYNYVFHSRCATIKTSFGCAFHCEFCFCIKVTRHNYFERDLPDVIEELKAIKEKNVFIVDDDFLFNKKRVREFLQLLTMHSIQKNYILFGRADFIVKNEDVVAGLKDAGLQAVFMGLESFKQEDLNHLNKRLSIEENVKAVRILEKYDIECYAGIIIRDDWSKTDFNHLIRWLNHFKRVFVNIQPLTPMPGTPLYDRLQQEIAVPRSSYEKWDMAHMVLTPKRLSIRDFYWNIIRAYYKTTTSPRAHLYILKKYGIRMYLRSLWGSLFITWQYTRMFLRGKEHV